MNPGLATSILRRKGFPGRGLYGGGYLEDTAVLDGEVGPVCGATGSVNDFPVFNEQVQHGVDSP